MMMTDTNAQLIAGVLVATRLAYIYLSKYWSEPLAKQGPLANHGYIEPCAKQGQNNWPKKVRTVSQTNVRTISQTMSEQLTKEDQNN
jgi:hypothetical protein